MQNSRTFRERGGEESRFLLPASTVEQGSSVRCEGRIDLGEPGHQARSR
jgi:hypothetical protein